MSCKLCSGNNVSKALEAANTHGRHLLNGGERFEIFRCADCGVFYINGLTVDRDYYSKYYPRDYYPAAGPAGNRYTGFLLRMAAGVAARIKQGYITKYSDSGGDRISILDIGCGCGEFLKMISSRLFEKYGLEVNACAAPFCEGESIKIYNQDIEQEDFKGKKFDAVTLWNVLEHLDSPKQKLLRIKGILKTGGILLIATPSTDSIGFSRGGGNWFHLDAPRHLFLYNTKSLLFLLKETGFRAVKIKNLFYDFPLDLFWSLRKGRMKYLAYPFYPVLKFLSRETILLICKIDR